MYGEDSPSPYRIITTLRRTERSVASALEEALRAVDLTAAQFHVLEELTVTEVLHTGELAWRLRVTRQSMHGIVQNLARAHLVELAPKEHGTRNVWLTEGGRDRLLKARDRVAPIERQVGAAVADGDRGPLVRLLSSIGRSVGATRREWWWD
jgi:DNA-binding MarR family transcriptional regulator